MRSEGSDGRAGLIRRRVPVARLWGAGNVNRFPLAASVAPGEHQHQADQPGKANELSRHGDFPNLPNASTERAMASPGSQANLGSEIDTESEDYLPTT